MENPLSQILPQALHFMSLNGSELMLLVGIMMFFGSFGGRIFQKLRIPQVVGYIVIGIIIGVSGFVLLGKDTVAALNPISTASLSLIGFLVGAELKIDVIKKYGKQFVGILIGESITPFFVVGVLTGSVTYLFTKSVAHSLSFGLILGAICAATAPAATTDVLKEYRTKGPLTTTILGIVAMDDAVALILYAIAATISAPLLGGHSVSFLAQLGAIAYDIFGSVILGLAFGFFLNLILKNIMNNDGRVLGFSLGTLFLCTGLCNSLGLDNILASMFIGFFMTNFAHPKTNAMFKLVEKFTPPIYVLFFVTVGAKLNIWIMTPFIAVIALLYVSGRTIGKTIGSRLGARLTGASESVRKYLPYCLLSQAGVAIGLSIAAGNDFSDSIGPQIMLIITATTFIVQILGPICVKYGVSKAGEVGLNITAEDLMKTAQVRDISIKGHVICRAESYTIVNDTDTVGSIISNFTHHENTNYEVRGNEGANKGKLVGQISIEHLKEAMQIGEMGEFLLAMDIMEKPRVTCQPELSLPEAYQLFSDYDTEAICVTNDSNEPQGMLEKFAVDHYIHSRIVELEHKLAKMEA
ncbi:MAG: cation:proton antiporter [Treponema sp.]|uniref:cation:proton antiporter domain-containing protein n=1 Tax=Treponema sp. TaxID=166 RepID=UPI0026013A5C|nr:cation:proton antiporter [Treponema sp.]MBQ9282959.1 cation:proton antiporter [Treponema sp.]